MNDGNEGNDGAALPTDTRQASLIAAFTTMFAAATIAIGLRLYTRIKFLHGLKIEDWLILGSWVTSLGVTIGFIRRECFGNNASPHSPFSLDPVSN